MAAVLARFAPHGPILPAGDDTVTGHPGTRAFGEGRRRDPARSTHTYTAFRRGHEWVALALLVPVPRATRRRALPLLVAPYRPRADNPGPGKPHKTPAQPLGQMARILMRRLPDRAFVVTADGGYAAPELAELAAKTPRRPTPVSLFYPDASPVEPPPEYSGGGRPRVKGEDLPGPAEVVAGVEQGRAREVARYGGGRRRVETVTGTGPWYRSGRPLVGLRWASVHDKSGTHRDGHFFTTGPTMSVASPIEACTGRWNIETTSEEVRSSLHPGTTRGRSRNTVPRVGPCLSGPDTVVAWLYAGLASRRSRARLVDWPGERDVSSSGAITAARRWSRAEWVPTIPGHRDDFQKLAAGSRRIVLNGLAQAA